MTKYLSAALLSLGLLLPLGCTVNYPIPQLPDNAGPTSLEQINGAWALDRGASRSFNCDFDSFFIYILDADDVKMEIDVNNQTITLRAGDKEPVTAEFTVVDINTLNPEVPTLTPFGAEKSIYLNLTGKAQVVEFTYYVESASNQSKLYMTRPDITGHDDNAVFVHPAPGGNPARAAAPAPQPGPAPNSALVPPAQYHYIQK